MTATSNSTVKKRIAGSRITLSTGVGRLHFVETAEAVSCDGVTINTISGWVPKAMPSWCVNLIGKLVCRDNLNQRLQIRLRLLKVSSRFSGLVIPEAVYHGLSICARLAGTDGTTASVISWKLFGWLSRHHLEGDIFHVRSGAGQGGAISAAKAKGMKVIVDHSIAHPVAMERNFGSVFRRFGKNFCYGANNAFWQLVLADCEQADVILVNSDYVKQTFIEEGYPPERIEVAYLGVRDDFIGLKQCYELYRPDHLRLLFTGFFSLRKGADVIFETARILIERGVSFTFEIAGDASEGLQILESHYPDLRNYFVFHGFLPQEDLRDLLAQCDVYVFPSYAEGCAKSVMEAMAAGLPVVCTRESGSPIVNAKDGEVIRVGDPFLLEAALMKLMSDTKLREQYGTRASKLIQNRYLWSDYGNKLQMLYEKMR